MNGPSVFQIKVPNKYAGDDCGEDLRTVLCRAGCKGEKICFIMDESNVLDSSFLERVNTLLANAEVPGLFEGDEYASLMTACKEGSQWDGLMLDLPEELYKWFSCQEFASCVYDESPQKRAGTCRDLAGSFQQMCPGLVWGLARSSILPSRHGVHQIT